MHDLETIRLALTGAETGHLVFGTLHTSSAAKTIDRVVDVFSAAEKEMVRNMLSELLRAVISQALLKRTGGGRIAAHEIMIGTPAIRNLIREGKIAQMYSAIQTGQSQGMQTLDQNLQELMTKGFITKEEARFRAANKEGERVAAVEIMLNTPYISELMLKGDISGVKEAFKSTNEPGIQRFDDALLGFYKNGRVSMEEALANSDPRADLEAKINFG